jgi:SPX domain protein involved in polyphosphate accumulation
MELVNRQEYKYYIKKEDLFFIKAYLKEVLINDINSVGDKYTISSLYFDTLNNDDYNQKLDGVMFREKYRIRIYNNDITSAKFEVKRKLNNCISKLSAKITEQDLVEIYKKNYSVLDKYKDLEYVSSRIGYMSYSPINIVTYDREAYTIPINNIRITIDSNLRTHGFNTDLFALNNAPTSIVQNNNLDILEVKFNNELPNFIKVFLSSFCSVRSAISKYALCRIHNNTEIKGDDPVIPF